MKLGQTSASGQYQVLTLSHQEGRAEPEGQFKREILGRSPTALAAPGTPIDVADSNTGSLTGAGSAGAVEGENQAE